MRVMPRAFPGLRLDFLRRSIGQGEPSAAIRQRNLYVGGMLMQGDLLVRTYMPAQHAHLRILELKLYSVAGLLSQGLVPEPLT